MFSSTLAGELRFGYQGFFQTSGSENGLAGDWLGTFKIPGMDLVRESRVAY